MITREYGGSFYYYYDNEPNIPDDIDVHMTQSQIEDRLRDAHENGNWTVVRHLLPRLDSAEMEAEESLQATLDKAKCTYCQAYFCTECHKSDMSKRVDSARGSTAGEHHLDTLERDEARGVDARPSQIDSASGKQNDFEPESQVMKNQKKTWVDVVTGTSHQTTHDGPSVAETEILSAEGLESKNAGPFGRQIRCPKAAPCIVSEKAAPRKSYAEVAASHAVQDKQRQQPEERKEATTITTPRRKEKAPLPTSESLTATEVILPNSGWSSPASHSQSDTAIFDSSTELQINVARKVVNLGKSFPRPDSHNFDWKSEYVNYRANRRNQDESPGFVQGSRTTKRELGDREIQQPGHTMPETGILQSASTEHMHFEKQYQDQDEPWLEADSGQTAVSAFVDNDDDGQLAASRTASPSDDETNGDPDEGDATFFDALSSLEKIEDLDMWDNTTAQDMRSETNKPDTVNQNSLTSGQVSKKRKKKNRGGEKARRRKAREAAKSDENIPMLPAQGSVWTIARLFSWLYETE